MDMKVTDSLEQRQVELEEQALGLGVARYYKEAEWDQAATPPGQRLLCEAISALQPAIQGYIDKELSKRSNPSRWLADTLAAFDAELLACVTATRCIQVLLAESNVMVQTVANEIAALLEGTLDYEALEKAESKLYQRVVRQPRAASRAIAKRKAQAKVNLTPTKWSKEDRTTIGVLLIGLFCESAGMATMKPVQVPKTAKGPPKTTLQLVPSPATAERLRAAHKAAEGLWPRRFPMIVQPHDWTTPHDGGYRTKAMRLTAVKTRDAGSAAYFHELHAIADPSKAYATLNVLQRTAWTVNEDVRAVMEQAWADGKALGGLPTRNPKPIPPEPANKAAKKAWSPVAAEIHSENHRLRGARSAAKEHLAMAERMQEFGRFYFVHTMDWRGRVYPVSDGLNPQGNDLARGLLKFADGCPLGDRGEFWLAVHGANCYGVDKVSLAERVHWVRRNEHDIRASAANLAKHRKWWAAKNVDSPWQFLAFCLEWSRLREWTNAGHQPQDFVSDLPVSVDGTCNGLQHFAALMRDEVGGAATNLLPGAKPSDIYQQVADKTSQAVEAAAARGDEMAKLWVGKISRTLAKKPTMTMPYGRTEAGLKNQLLGTLRDHKRDTGEDIIDREHRFDACLWLTPVMDNAVGDVVVSAKVAMDWLRTFGGLAANVEHALWWTAPSGVLVRMLYQVNANKILDRTINGRRFTLTLADEGEVRRRVDKRKTKAGMAPNFVHALDAAHLVRSVEYAHAAGVTAFRMVHDSYGTHAGKMAVLAHELRRAFVDQHTPNLLELFREGAIFHLRHHPELAKELPPVPAAAGDLDLAKVMESDYFFS